MRTNRVRILALAIVMLAVSSVHAVITAPPALDAVLRNYPHILVTKVEKLYPDKPAMILAVAEDLKGKTPFRKLPINLLGGEEAKKDKHTEILLKRLAEDMPVILFINPRGKKLTTFGFTNGTWFQLEGTRTGEDTIAWAFVGCEPYFRRTFKGTTGELKQVIQDGLSGKKAPPAPDLKEKPGYGPEASQKKSERTSADEPGKRGSRTLFAVIPTLGVGGPLAILALLFPSVFGDVRMLFRQWAAFFTVISLISLAYLVQMVFPTWLRGTWLATNAGWWFLLTAMTFGCAVWSWRRYIHWAADPAIYPATKRTEVVMLWVMTSLCAVMLVVAYLIWEPNRYDPNWNLFLILTGGLALGTLYTSYRGLVNERRYTPAMPSEGIILFASLFGMMAFGALRWGGESTAAVVPVEQGKQAQSTGEHRARFAGKIWHHVARDNEQPLSGLFVSTAFLDGDRVYIAAANPTLKYGNLYCLDRASGSELWKFDDDGEFKQAFSSPCIADGKLFIGEGWHDDKKCRVFCLDLKNVDPKTKAPKKLWAFQTNSQTESTPAYANGKLYIGGGNDGFYCLDASRGTKVWQFPPEKGKRLLRFGAGATVADNKVLVGTGVDRNLPDDKGETALFCLDAQTGKEIWKVGVDYPCWGTPAVHGEHVFFGIGNGDIFTDDEKPGGALLCIEIKTGKIAWPVKIANGVLERPVVDANSVYFTCRDGNCYCLDRKDGKERWRAFLGSPIFAGPALAPCSGCGKTAAVYAVATGGKVACLDPLTGKEHWSVNLEKERNPFLASTPRVAVLRDADGDRRRLYFGAGLDNVPAGQAVVFCLEDRVAVER